MDKMPITHNVGPPKATRSSQLLSVDNPDSKARQQVGAPFLPAIVDEAYQNALEGVLKTICYAMGFDDIEEPALETLLLVFHSYIKRIGEQSRLACEIAGRTIVSPADVMFALTNMGIKFEELPAFFAEQLNIKMPDFEPEFALAKPEREGLIIGEREEPLPHAYSWHPPLPDPHTYKKTEIHHEPEYSYVNIRHLMARRQEEAVQSLNNFMIRTKPSVCLFPKFEQIIHEAVKKVFEQESEEKRMEEAFIAFRALLKTDDVDEVENLGELLLERGLITEVERDSGTDAVVMCSDGALIDQKGERVYLTEDTVIDFGGDTALNRVGTFGAESLNYHMSVDEIVDSTIELDSVTMDLDKENNSQKKTKDELKYMQQTTAFEYLPEWCHVLDPSLTDGHRSYFLNTAELLKDENSKNGCVRETVEEMRTKSEKVGHLNLYLYPPTRNEEVDDEHDVVMTDAQQ